LFNLKNILHFTYKNMDKSAMKKSTAYWSQTSKCLNPLLALKANKHPKCHKYFYIMSAKYYNTYFICMQNLSDSPHLLWMQMHSIWLALLYFKRKGNISPSMHFLLCCHSKIEHVPWYNCLLFIHTYKFRLYVNTHFIVSISKSGGWR